MDARTLCVTVAAFRLLSPAPDHRPIWQLGSHGRSDRSQHENAELALCPVALRPVPRHPRQIGLGRLSIPWTHLAPMCAYSSCFAAGESSDARWEAISLRMVMRCFIHSSDFPLLASEAESSFRRLLTSESG